MAEPPVAPPGTGLVSRLRHGPLGVVFIAAFFAMIGLASVAGGAYLMLENGSVSLWAASTAIVMGPAILYLSYHLVHLAHWAWLALAVLLALLFLSSLARLATSLGFPAPAVGELAIELALAVYLTRPHIRAAFGWGRRARSVVGGSPGADPRLATRGGRLHQRRRTRPEHRPPDRHDPADDE